MKRIVKLSFVIPFAFLSVAALAQSNGAPGSAPGSVPSPSASPATAPVTQPPATQQQPATQPFGTQQPATQQPFGTQPATTQPATTQPFGTQPGTYNNQQPAIQDTTIKDTMGASGDTLSPNGDIVSPPPAPADTSGSKSPFPDANDK